MGAEEGSGDGSGNARGATAGFTARQSWRRTLLELGAVALAIALLIAGLRGCSGPLSSFVVSQLPARADELIGKAAGQAMRARYGVTGTEPTAEQRARTERVFDELRSKLTDEERRILAAPRLTVVDDDQVNAFCLPGGEVFVLTGLLERTAGDDDMLSGVLAHEIGHAVKRHGVRGIVQNAVYGITLSLLLGGADGALAAVVSGAAQLSQLKHSRGMEEEADAFGVELLRRVGRSHEGLARFLEGLEAVPIPELVSTHPDSKERAKAIRALR